jgi:hypothetical protein
MKLPALVPKLRLGTHALEAPASGLPGKQSFAFRIPKRSLGTSERRHSGMDAGIQAMDGNLSLAQIPKSGIQS